MYKDTVTVFNRKPGERGSGDTWYPTVISGVNLNVDRAAIAAKYGQDSNDSAYMGIHYQKENGALVVAGKPYQKPKEWGGTNDTVTFASTGDFFWQGKWDGGVVADTDPEYESEGFYGYMNRVHDNVFTISSVAIHSVIPLIEVWGK